MKVIVEIELPDSPQDKWDSNGERYPDQKTCFVGISKEYLKPSFDGFYTFKVIKYVKD